MAGNFFAAGPASPEANVTAMSLPGAVSAKLIGREARVTEREG
jgi:hypothetical protein